MSKAQAPVNDNEYTLDDIQTIWDGYIQEHPDQKLTDTIGKTTVWEPPDTQAEKILRTVELPHGSAPDGIALFQQELQKYDQEAFRFDIYQEFKLLERIGEGSMGLVFKAYQGSFDRNVIIKMIKPDYACNEVARYKFLTEARVTGNLNHPNIVPVYELSKVEDVLLFYVMKQVEGTPWSEVIAQQTETENLEILLRVCDAISFAHSKGIIHRDLKPENIMLGDYGEVLVADWGLALSITNTGKAEKLTQHTAGGGSPAYMAPEMAKCDNTRIGIRTDIYLLGGILYEIVTGLRPHHGESVSDCILMAIHNHLQPTDKTGGLVDIALKAMASNPEGRYESVKAFQHALREYQHHSQSIGIMSSAQQDFDRAQHSKHYEDFVQSLFGFRKALEMWPENEGVKKNIEDVTLAYAQCAYEKGDYDLSLSLLNSESSTHLALIQKVVKARRDRKRHKKIVKVWLYSFLVLLTTGLSFILLAIFWAARTSEQKIVVENQILKVEMEVSREKYFHNIALAAMKITDSAFDQSKRLLSDTSEALRGWEWNRLMYVTEHGGSLSSTRDPAEAQGLMILQGHQAAVKAVAFSPDSSQIVTGSLDTTVKIWDLNTGKIMQTLRGHTAPVYAAAFSPDGRQVLTGSSDTTVKLWNVMQGEAITTLHAHSRSVRTAAFSPDGKYFMTGSWDATAKIWNREDLQIQHTLNGHTRAIVSVAFAANGQRVVTGSLDRTAKIWDVASGKEIGTLAGHQDVVSAVAWSPNGDYIVTGSLDGTAKIWDVNTAQEISLLQGHRAGVESVAFSPDNKRVVTISQDHTVKIWDVRTGVEMLSLKEDASPLCCSVAFSANGRYLATATDSNIVVVWDSYHSHEE